MDLTSVPFTVFDIEIKKPIAQCSKGWESHDEMGIAVLAAWEGPPACPRFFDEHSLASAVRYLDAAVVLGGFNTLRFDLRVLGATLGKVIGQEPAKDLMASLESKPHVDVLALLIEAEFEMGIEDAVAKFGGARVFGGGKRLEDVASLTIGEHKTGSGGSAPLWYAAGDIARVFDYCTQDVWLEWHLVQEVLRRQEVAWGRDGVRNVTKLTFPPNVLELAHDLKTDLCGGQTVPVPL